ncbi:hypothetical protein L596_013558 [Steinernema carpocapsae]|uniref:Uncharacterized protein n=1 Tax=Steinernema carpocapsae TaxID=34508 RepID=A0A4U5P0I8_STECR|nr:hypothetical protein L596_013558 [Steinernema carpocapsae]
MVGRTSSELRSRSDRSAACQCQMSRSLTWFSPFRTRASAGSCRPVGPLQSSPGTRPIISLLLRPNKDLLRPFSAVALRLTSLTGATGLNIRSFGLSKQLKIGRSGLVSLTRL